MRAAACAIDIDHPKSVRLSGFASREGDNKGIHDCPQARLLLLDDGTKRFLWIALDLIGISVTADANLRESCGKLLCMPSDQILVSCSHTHAAGASIRLRGTTSPLDPVWLDSVFGSIVSAAGTLNSGLVEATLATGHSRVADLAYNREKEDGPADDTLTVVRVDALDGSIIASVFNYAMHPVALGGSNRLVSGEYPGLACRKVEARLGGVCLFIQGACGDLDPVLMVSSSGRATFEQLDKLATSLADEATYLLDAAKPLSSHRIEVRSELVSIPLDPAPSFADLRIERAAITQKAGGDYGAWSAPELEWIKDVERALARGAVPQQIAARITTLRIGALAVVAMPLEPYCEISLSLRRLVGSHTLIFAAYTNGLLGYLPTQEAKERGGYGPSRSHRFFPETLTPISGSAASEVIDHSIRLLEGCRSAELVA